MVLGNTEKAGSPNLMSSLIRGAPLICAFTGMAMGLNELANFEFVKSLKDIEYSKIFVRDPNFSFYHMGIDSETENIMQVSEKLGSQIEEANPSKFVFVGVSAGGFAALLFGHLLGADKVHAFGPQTVLFKEWGVEHNDPTIYQSKIHDFYIAPENDWRDLEKVLSNHNGTTTYYVHVGKKCIQDMNHANHIKDCSGVELVLYDCDTHACASQKLRAQGALGKVITG